MLQLKGNRTYIIYHWSRGGGAWTKGICPTGVPDWGGGGALGVLVPNDLILPTMALRPPPWTALSAVRIDVSTVPSGRDESATDMAQAHSRRAATSNEVVAMTSGAATARRLVAGAKRWCKCDGA